MPSVIRALILAGLALPIGTAQAATMTLTGGSPLDFTTYGSAYNPSGAAALLHEDLTVFDGSDPAPGITLAGPGTLTVEFLGKEANASAAAFSAGGSISSVSGPTSYTVAVAGGPLDFSFSSAIGTLAGNTSGFVGSAALAFSQVYDNVVYAFFDDSGFDYDRDFDDMVVKITVTPLDAVSLPASGLLLGGLVLGIGAWRKRRRA